MYYVKITIHYINPPGEFEETYGARRNDVSVRKRREMDEGIPWDQLNFSVCIFHVYLINKLDNMT